MQILPVDTATVLLADFSAVVGANIAPVIALLGTFVGIKFIRRMLNKSTNGRV